MTLIIIQILLGLVFLMAGAMKTFKPEKAFKKMEVLRMYPKKFITFIGISEMAGALGITLPVWLGIAPFLTPLAAVGLGIIVLGAFYAHAKRKEFPQLLMALLFLVGLVFIFVQTYA